MPVNALKPLLAKPNPIPMTRWLTIGALDADEWSTLGGARWRQRAGRIVVEGEGQGIGRRSLCLSKRPGPKVPFEIAVTVKLDDESGAAGLVFHSDGGDKHYGFYPSNGALRFTLFDGPDVYDWKVLHQAECAHYRPGEWNTFKVRVEKDRILCYCNDQLWHESKDTSRSEGKIGLVKFRETKAEFKHFQVGDKVTSGTIPAEVTARVVKAVKDIPTDGPPKPALIDKLTPNGDAGMQALRDRARQLEQEAAQLRLVAQAVHQRRVLADLAKAAAGKDEEIDLLYAALLIARLDNEGLDIEHYRKEVERMARDVTKSLPKDADDRTKLDALNKYLFTERGFHGSRGDYYHRSNSYLNEVIDDREGLPITLALLYMELAQRIGVKLVGVGLPGHFVVRHEPAKGESSLIDVYENGAIMTKEQAEKRVLAITGKPLKPAHLAAMNRKAILVRLVQNLLNLARDDHDVRGGLRYLDAILVLTPDSAQDRWMRAILRYNVKQREGALEDADWLLEHDPEGIEMKRV
jgi:regulator of sirC expression with transglutaminase-like and TPR domain